MILETSSGEDLKPVDANDEVTPHFEEIEGLLTRVELEVGLNNLMVASSLFRQLMRLVEGHDVTAHQQARIHTMSELLTDTLAGVHLDETRIFSGSDAATKVMNMMGFTPEGYRFVYHEIPSFIGSEGLGYYVFLIPVDPDDLGETGVRDMFFVTDRGEILVFE